MFDKHTQALGICLLLPFYYPKTNSSEFTACACLETSAPLRGADKHTPQPTENVGKTEKQNGSGARCRAQAYRDHLYAVAVF